MDFTLKIYRELLLALQHKGYSFCTFQEYCNGNAVGKYVILRHDIDKSPYNALRFAKLEAEMGIKSTYFFLILKEIFKPSVIKQIADLGHEVGYHYRDFVDAGGNAQKSIYSFEANLNRLRAIVPIYTIAMDGCPWSKYDNKDLWKTYNYRDFGIIGEPYFDIDFNKVFYLTDTGRMWDGARYSVRDKVLVDSGQFSVDSSEMVVPIAIGSSGEIVDGSGKNKLSTTNYQLSTTFHSTNDIIESIEFGNFPSQVMITTHPQRWTDNKMEWIQELILQRVKNVVKKFLIISRYK